MRPIITVGLSYGDEGKGTVVDALVRKHNASVVVRYNGGAQAAHNVVDENGRQHTFAQFGSGSFVPGVKTFLSKFMLVNPLSMQMEAKALEKIGVAQPLSRMFVDGRCLVTTPYHRALNRLREMARSKSRHGSCGMGIGETMQDFIDRGEDAIRVKDINYHDAFRKKFYATHAAMREKVRQIQSTGQLDETSDDVQRELSTFEVRTDGLLDRYHDWRSNISVYDVEATRLLLGNQDVVVFEGAQGVLLDEVCGFQPYTTWSTTTSRNAYSILEELDLNRDTHEIGIVRTFSTRHGPGPFVTEDETLRDCVADDHNGYNDWQRGFRCGWFDAVMLKYAIRVNGPLDSLAVTHSDKLIKRTDWQMCHDYGFEVVPRPDMRWQAVLTDRILSQAKPAYERVLANQVVDWIAKQANAPVSLVSFGPKSNDKHFT